MKVKMQESSGFDLHEADEWLAGEIVGIEEAADKGFGPGLKWVIRLDGDDWETWAWSSQILSKKSKLYRWLTDLGEDPDVGDDIDLAAFIGRRVEVMFEHGTDAEGATRDKVTRIRAEKKSGNSKPKAKPLKVVEDDDEAPF